MGKFSFLQLWLGLYSVIFVVVVVVGGGGVLQVMLPSEILKPPTDPPMRGFPTV